MSRTRAALQALVTYASYPAALAACAGVCAYAVRHRLDYGAVHMTLMLGVIASHIALEALLLLERRRRMSLRSFLGRDLKYLALNGVVESLGRVAVGTLAIRLSLSARGPMRSWPAYLALPALLLLFEVLQY